MKFGRLARLNAAVCLAGALTLSSANAAEGTPAEAAAAAATRTQTDTANKENKSLSADEVAALKAQIAEQQKQIDQLRKAIESQQKMLEHSLNSGNTEAASAPAAAGSTSVDSPFPKLGEVASRTPVVPSSNVSASRAAFQKPGAEGAAERPSPLYFSIGAAHFTPFGFADFTSVTRTTNTNGAIGTGFSSIPFNNTLQGHLSESRLSEQNSRLGLRVDTNFKGTDITAYLETDFLGNAANGLVVTSNANTLRMRLFWAQFKRDNWEILAGQSWSMMTPNRKGISPFPGDIFYSQDVDTNYQNGLTWARQAGFRVILHATKAVTWGLALENPDPYVGGAVTFPSALGSAYPAQFDASTVTTNAPPLTPDFISKLAFDGTPGGKAMHFEIRGLLSTFRTYNANTNQHYSKIGGGGAVGFNLEIVKNLRMIGDGYVSDGGGRYIIGSAPDLVPHLNGDISLVHAASTVDGLEYSFKPHNNPNAKETLFYGYYGGVFIGNNYSVIPGATPTAAPTYYGYGFPGSANSNNRSIQEITFGLHQTFWKSANYGDVRLMTQYSYLSRDPWYNAANATQKNASTNMIFLNLRYDLP